MAKFDVKVKIYGWASQEVEANTKEEAIEKAKANPKDWGANDFLWYWNNNEILSANNVDEENIEWFDEEEISTWFAV